MDNGTRKKKDQLGINPGTASSILKKSIMYSMARRLGEDVCYQCKEKIKSIDEFSVEHKKPWLDSDDPKGLFFDLDNIAFSHMSCNIKARRAGRIAKHPSHYTYLRGCRCDECKEVERIKVKKYRAKQKLPSGRVG